MENIFQHTDIEPSSDSSESLASASDKARTGIITDNGLANSTRPLRIARNQSDTVGLGAPSWAEIECPASLNAPQYAPCSKRLDRHSPLSWQSRLISCPVSDLRPHPSYARHKLSVDAAQLSTLADRGDRAFCDPIAITFDRVVIDGYARLELARRRGRPMLDCFVHELGTEDALEELIRTHSGSQGLPDFVRIEMALDLEPHFHARALMNQQSGGQGKGLSKLTAAQQINTRREVARLAGVSSGNVHKVRNILTNACPALLEAAREEEVSINLAEKWCRKPEAQQQQYLRLMRIDRGLRRKARNLVAAHLDRISPSSSQVIRLSDLVELLTDIGSVEVAIVDAPGKAIVVTRELIHSLAPRQGVLAG